MPWKKLLISLAALVASLLVAEGALRVLLAGRGAAWSSSVARERLESLRDLARNYVDAEEAGARQAVDRRYRGADVLHPYFTFDLAEGAEQVARDLQSSARSPRDFRILILGGSVAAIFGARGTPRLAELLQADPRLAGRRIHFLRYARAGSKQPQQLMAAAYLFSLGLVPDVVLELDGFNEVAVGSANYLRGSHPTWPAHDKWLALASAGLQNEEQRAAGAALRARRIALLERTEGVLDSALLSSALFGRWRVLRLEAGFAALRDDQLELAAGIAESSLPGYLLGPPYTGGAERVLPTLVEHWKQSSLSIRALCDSRSIAYLHVLQPALHDKGSKPFNQAELAGGETIEAWKQGVRLGYPLLRAAGAELRAAGVNFLDATQVFAQVEERIYRDACHFGERGNELLAELIAPALLELLDQR